jgi:hypothetical protein
VRRTALLSVLGSLAIGLAACGRVALELPDDGVGGGAGISGAGGSRTGSGGQTTGAGGAPAGAGVGGHGSGGVAGIGGKSGVGGATVDCSSFGEATCLQLGATCRTEYCPSCPGDRFVRCSAPSNPPFLCPPAPPCVPPPPCSTVASFDACDARSDCHPVFVDMPSICNCGAGGCCLRFQRCADAAYARCQPPPAWTCPATTPTPACAAGGYALAYSNPCFEGCVRKQDCDLL